MQNKKIISLFTYTKNYLSKNQNILKIFLIFSFLLASFGAAGEAMAGPLVVNPDHTISINNQKVFPVTIYNLCSMDIAKGGGETKCTSSLTANNNTIFNYETSQPSYVSKYEAARMGFSLKAGSSSNKDSPMAYTIQLTANCPGDSMCDEPDYGTSTDHLIRDHVLAHLQSAKNNLPNLPIWMNNWQDMIEWLPYVDIYAFDGYTNTKAKIPSKYSRADMVYANERWFMQSMGGKKWNDPIFNNKSIWVVILAYGTHAGYPSDPIGIPLTKIEARAMTWDSIASGAQGIAYYGWLPWGDSTPSPGVHDSPEAQYYRDIASEIRSLNNILILPTKTLFWENDKNNSYVNVTPNPLKTVYSGWGQQNSFTYLLKQPDATISYLIVVNKDTTPISNVSISVGGISNVRTVKYLGNETSGSGRSTASDPSHTLATSAIGSFTDSFDGYAVHIYQICAASSLCLVPPPPSYSPPPPPVSSPPPPHAIAGKLKHYGSNFKADNGTMGGPCCGPAGSHRGLKPGDIGYGCSYYADYGGVLGSYTPDTACSEAYGAGSIAGNNLGKYNKTISICDQSINSDVADIYECLPPPPTPTPTSTPTPPPPAPPCAKWKDGTPDSGICLEVATSIFQGDTKSGNISTDPGKFIIRILTIILGFAGGIALLLIISSGYKIILSKGKPEGIQQGKEQLTAALVGLVFIIFSFVIFQFVIADILKIPGITK